MPEPTDFSIFWLRELCPFPDNIICTVTNEDVSEELENPSVGIDTLLPEDKTSIAEESSALEIHEEAT